MCGFGGIWAPSIQSSDIRCHLRAMGDAIKHRGPDDEGYWSDEHARIGIMHRRLSILDLTPSGHQPMISHSGRYVIAFNGEIYNHQDLRADMKSAPVWRGHSDTETLLAAVENWGLEETLRRTVGMFAFALWDRETRTLHLARDRFGEKPLYYGWIKKKFVFGSELKAFRAHRDFDNKISADALGVYLRHSYIPAPHSIYQGIYKLPPGCLLTAQTPISPPASDRPLDVGNSCASFHIKQWWSLDSVLRQGGEVSYADEGEALDELEARLQDAVRLQSLADVPVGAFLSGGIDSSLIAALMQEQAPRSIKTFTIGFDDQEYDESQHASAVAKHLGTEHIDVKLSPADALAVIPKLPWMYDEPFADASQIPTHLVCAVARREVTVALSGDGGDELFGGYNRYFWGPRVWKTFGRLPLTLRNGLSFLLRKTPPQIWNQLLSPSIITRGAEKLQKLGHALRGARSIDSLYENLTSTLLLDCDLLRTATTSGIELPEVPSSIAMSPSEKMMYWDTLTYLPGDILCKVDRAAMAVSLETRAPFLDHRVCELAWRLPLSMKIRQGQGKWALRQVLYRRVPKELIERPKTGFGVPIGDWLKGPLKEWASSLLSNETLNRDGFFDAAAVQQLWAQHLHGGVDRTTPLWNILMFQAWLEEVRTSHFYVTTI